MPILTSSLPHVSPVTIFLKSSCVIPTVVLVKASSPPSAAFCKLMTSLKLKLRLESVSVSFAKDRPLPICEPDSGNINPIPALASANKLSMTVVAPPTKSVVSKLTLSGSPSEEYSITPPLMSASASLTLMLSPAASTLAPLSREMPACAKVRASSYSTSPSATKSPVLKCTPSSIHSKAVFASMIKLPATASNP